MAGFGIDWSVCDWGMSLGLLLHMCRQAQVLGSCSEGVAAVVEPVENSSYLCLRYEHWLVPLCCGMSAGRTCLELLARQMSCGSTVE